MTTNIYDMEQKIKNEAKRVFGKGKVSAAFELGGEYVLSQIHQINDLAKRSYTTALRRGKTCDDLSHTDTAFGIFDELIEFRNSSEVAPSTHLPQHTEAQEELADIIIAGFTELYRRGVDVEKIITDKIKFNETR